MIKSYWGYDSLLGWSQQHSNKYLRYNVILVVHFFGGATPYGYRGRVEITIKIRIIFIRFFRGAKAYSVKVEDFGFGGCRAPQNVPPLNLGGVGGNIEISEMVNQRNFPNVQKYTRYVKIS